MSKKVEFTVNADIHGFKAGQTIMLDLDKRGIPVERTWRRRLKDAKIDGCITKTEQPKPKSSDNKDK